MRNLRFIQPKPTGTLFSPSFPLFRSLSPSLSSLPSPLQPQPKTYRNKALAAVVPIVVHGQTDTRAAGRAVLPQALDLAPVVDLVELEGGELDGLVLVVDLLGLGVHLLLALLPAASQTQDQVQGGLLLDVVVRERAAVLQLLAREDEALLVRGDALLVLDLLLHILDRVAGLDIEGDGLARQGLDEDLHLRAVVVGFEW